MACSTLELCIYFVFSSSISDNVNTYSFFLSRIFKEDFLHVDSGVRIAFSRVCRASESQFEVTCRLMEILKAMKIAPPVEFRYG